MAKRMPGVVSVIAGRRAMRVGLIGSTRFGDQAIRDSVDPRGA
jgi:hypothetical protein